MAPAHGTTRANRDGSTAAANAATRAADPERSTTAARDADTRPLDVPRRAALGIRGGGLEVDASGAGVSRGGLKKARPAERSVSRVLCTVTIPLGPSLPAGSSNQPGV